MKWFCFYCLLKVNDCNILPGQKQTLYNAHYDHCELFLLLRQQVHKAEVLYVMPVVIRGISSKKAVDVEWKRVEVSS